MFDTVHQDEVAKQEQKIRDLKGKRWDEIIRSFAYQLWEQAGKPDGRADEFWHAAQREMNVARQIALYQLKIIYWRGMYETLLKTHNKLLEAHGAKTGTPRSDDRSLGDEHHREGDEAGGRNFDAARGPQDYVGQDGTTDVQIGQR